jgi:hypothetical protein
MPRPTLVSVNTPFSQRLLDGLRYPLHNAALTSIIVIALTHYLGLLPMVGWAMDLIAWAAIYAYAFECLRRTADGYADPPELVMETDPRIAWALIVLQVLGIFLALIAPILLGAPGLVLSVLLALALPAATMSLAYDGNLGLALNPMTWIEVMGRFGAPYFVLTGICLLTATLQWFARGALDGMLPRLLALPVSYFIANYATVLNFHLMGSLIHQHSERLGLEPGSLKQTREMGYDADEMLLEDARTVESRDLAAATDLLTERLRGHGAPPSVHSEYRRLLRLGGRHPELLVHGQIWIAALVASGDLRRALGVAQECIDLDPDFLPDAPDTAGPLAERATQAGMPRLALKLSYGYLCAWPVDIEAPRFGLIAVRTLIELDESADARRLLGRIEETWPDHPLRYEMERLDRLLREAPAALIPEAKQ